MNTSDRLTGLMSSNRREALKCTRGKAYLAAIVMRAAALEAGLQAMCFLYPEEVKKHFRGRRNKSLEFSLYQLIDLAEECLTSAEMGAI
jgi:hypothetical protein